MARLICRVLIGTALPTITLVLGLVGCETRSSQPKPVAPTPTQEAALEPAKSEPASESSMPGSNTPAKLQGASPGSPPKPAEKAETDHTDAPAGHATKDRKDDGQMVAPNPTSPAQPVAWTSQHLVVMGKGGPRFLKLNVNVGGQDLDHGFQAALAKIAQGLSMDFAQPMTWEELLDKPLIASGWLGNLVPSSEQRSQLRNLYDTNKDEKVDEAEFRSFLTRGLTRIAPLRVVSRPSTAPVFPSESPWGPIDKDDSGDLSLEELNEVSQNMLRFDFDGDRILTPGELRSANDADSNRSPRRPGTMMLDLNPVHVRDKSKPEAMAQAVLENYSFGTNLSTNLLFAWPNERLKQIDVDHDATITLDEMSKVSGEGIEDEFDFTFPDQTAENRENVSVSFRSIGSKQDASWIGHTQGGRLTLDGCIVTIVLNDEQGSGVHQAFAAQLERFEQDAQLQAFGMQALELKEGAMDVLKSATQQRKVPASDIAWEWLIEPRHWHIQIGWSASDSPWFELMDLNGDEKLVQAELDQFSRQAKSWDRNKDGTISTEEMPVSVLLEVKRPEARGLKSRLGGTAVEKRGTNVGSAPTWFTGMDYNSDGELSQSEFLGERADFEKLDRNRDGIIEVREVTTPQ